MIETSLTITLSLEEVCHRADLPNEVLIAIVEEGILSPPGQGPEEWCFDAAMLCIAKRAARLHRDLDIEWSSIPLFLDMLDELEQLRTENRILHQRLSRFLLEEEN